MKRGEARYASQALLVLFGFWLVISPWVFGYGRPVHAMQDAVVGVLLGREGDGAGDAEGGDVHGTVSLRGVRWV